VQAEMSDEEVREILTDLQLREDGVISFTEFLAATLNREFFFDEKRITQVFRVIDVDHSGKMSFENLNECFKRRGMNKSKKCI
jgi:Ca2+-binding EF-hand superfamily protein